MRRHFLPQLWLQSQRQVVALVKWVLICDISTSHNTSESYLEKYYPEILSLLFQGGSYQSARKKIDCAQALFFFLGNWVGWGCYDPQTGYSGPREALSIYPYSIDIIRDIFPSHLTLS